MIEFEQTFHIPKYLKWLIFIVFYSVVLIIIVFYFTKEAERCEKLENDLLNIPANFLIGAASSSSQIEGATKVDGKTESYIESRWHDSYGKANRTDLDISGNSYYFYKKDVQALKYIGVNVYRFSLSWPRLLPTGYPDNVNEAGVRYYHSLLDELEKNGIQPFITLYHFDHPALFEKFGGWLNESMVDAFGQYARFVFQEYGFRVKMFLTINEPHIPAYIPESLLLNDTKTNLADTYLRAHNLLKAHARTYHIYDKEFRSKQNGIIGLVLLCTHFYAQEPEDHFSADEAFQFSCGHFAHPIFSKTGDYSEIIKRRTLESSKKNGLKKSKLPTFSEEWINYIKGSADYFGLNYYNTSLAAPRSKYNGIIRDDDSDVVLKKDPRYFSTPAGHLIAPRALRNLLQKIKNDYNNPPIHITESGIGTYWELNDISRIQYLYLHMKEVLEAIKYDNCDIRSYIVWSLIDSWEFVSNYTAPFGLIHVDFNDPNRTRSPKASAIWLHNVIAKKQLYFDINEYFERVYLEQ